MLPSYTVRESQRAKHVSLRISAAGQLEVVIPPGFDRTKIPDIVRRKQTWIERATHRVQQNRSVSDPAEIGSPPGKIDLQAIAETWQITYHATPSPGVRAVEKKHLHLEVYGQTSNLALCRSVLRQWLIYKATTHLMPQLRKISQTVKLSFQRASVRQQKTLWGSCSSQKNISLNSKLLFLPEDMVRYVMIHELCHTIHMNHSADFWTLVSQHEPHYKQLDKDLNQARQWVPLWVEMDS